jgi:hypothetical protein
MGDRGCDMARPARERRASKETRLNPAQKWFEVQSPSGESSITSPAVDARGGVGA